MKRITSGIALCATAGALLASAGPAQAATVKCKIGYYSPGADEAKPTPSALRAIGLPKKTDGYAPPCLVAESIVAEIQRGFTDGGALPKSVTVNGARWTSGKFNCSYAGGTAGVQKATCKKAGKPSRKIKVDLAA